LEEKGKIDGLREGADSVGDVAVEVDLVAGKRERSGGGGVEGDAGEGSAVGEIVVGGEADGAVEGEDDARGGGDGADPVEGVGEVVVAACAVPGEGGCGVGRISEEEGCDGSYGEGEPFCRPFRLTIARATHFPLVLSAT